MLQNEEVKRVLPADMLPGSTLLPAQALLSTGSLLSTQALLPAEALLQCLHERLWQMCGNPLLPYGPRLRCRMCTGCSRRSGTCPDQCTRPGSGPRQLIAYLKSFESSEPSASPLTAFFIQATRFSTPIQVLVPPPICSEF